MIDPYKGLNEYVGGLMKTKRNWIFIIAIVFLFFMLAGCSSMKEMVWTSGVGAGVGTAVSVATGNPVPSIVAGALSSGVTAGLIADSSAATSNPENATSGYGVAAVVGKESIRWLGICGGLLVIFGWLVPSPFKLNRREKTS